MPRLESWHGWQSAYRVQVYLIGLAAPFLRYSVPKTLIFAKDDSHAVSRSSLLLAEHPGDNSRRVLVRGKGNLSATPPAVEFQIATKRFEANGHQFAVPQAGNFSTSGLTVADLLGQPAAEPRVGKARSTARQMIATSLADQGWHEAGPVIEECLARGIDPRIARRAADDLRVESEPVPGAFPARRRWRLPGRRADGPSTDSAVRSVRTETPTQDCGSDSADSADSVDKRSGIASRSGLEVDPDAELAPPDAKGLAE
jgi:hypothetical protein